MALTFAAASSATARPAVADGMPRSWASGMRCVSTKPVVVMPQTKNGAASDQNPRERARPRRPVAAAGAAATLSGAPAGGGGGGGAVRVAGGGRCGRGERAADRLETDVLGSVAQAPPQDRRNDAGEERAPRDTRPAPARRGDEEQRGRHEQELAGAEAGLDEREGKAAPGGEPVRHRDRGGDAARSAEAERRDHAVGDRELPRRLRRRAQRHSGGDDQRADRQRPADAEAVDGAADERLRAAGHPE